MKKNKETKGISMNNYYEKIKGSRPLSTLTEEEYTMLKEMGLLWKLYPETAPEYADISMKEVNNSKQKIKN